jgi:nitrate/TMAO reductase-like tetraheme cytochrome c subunit
MWQKIKNFSRKDPLLFVLVIVAIVVGATFAGLEGMHMTGTDKFCKICHAEQRVGVRGEHFTWDKNIHSKADVSCLDCHGEPGIVGYLDAHIIAGTKSTIYEIFVSNEKVRELLTHAASDPVAAEHAAPDESCLFCHSDDYNAQMRRDRIMSVGPHFRNIDEVKNPAYRTEYGLADVMAGAVSKGVEPNHAKHIDAGLHCSNCHLGVAHGGELYNEPEMETCFACHDDIRNEIASVPANDDCAACHVMQKGIQEGTYVKSVEEYRWYMADLSCGDCHESAFVRPNSDKCAMCHDESYAEILFDIQKTYQEKLAAAQTIAAAFFEQRENMPEGKRAIYNELARLVRILEKDGSEGVHNPEYFDSIFDKAGELAEAVDSWTAPAEEEAEHAAPAHEAKAEEAHEEPAFEGNPAELMEIVEAVEIINLAEMHVASPTKPAVNFPHKDHAERLACTECHSEPENGILKVELGEIKGMKNDFHEKVCFDCHKKNRVSKSCNTCHK